MLREKYSTVVNALSEFLGLAKKDYKSNTPKEGEDTVSDFVQSLFDDGLAAEQNHWVETAKTRPTVLGVVGSYTPRAFREYCDQLEAGNDWEVWGRRNTGVGNQWKQESVDGLVGRNMRTRRAYITANYHDIVISPNIQHANDFYDQERKANGYGEWLQEFVHTGQAYGLATSRIYVDTTEEMPRLRRIVCEPGKVVRTPNTKSYAKRDGCWYVAHGTMINDKQAEEMFGSLEGLTESKTLSEKMIATTDRPVEYKHTKMFPMIDIFLDDNTIEEIPFTEEEEDELAEEIEVMTLGHMQEVVQPDGSVVPQRVPIFDIPARPEQNHKIHIEAKQAALQNAMSVLPEDESMMMPEDMAYAHATMSALAENIAQHTEMMDDDDLASLGLRYKYPYGRYVCKVSEKVYKDCPSEYANYERGIGVDWRKLFDDLKNEAVLNRVDGRGDPEILWNDAKACDTALSRYDDSVILAVGKVYRNIQDKQNPLCETKDNDPLAVEYYASTPPEVVTRKVASENLEVWKIRRGNASESQGVNSITIGGEPENQTSGYQTELLQRQNEQMVTGELDRNLRQSLERQIETELELMKVFFVAPRPYFINGQIQYITVSDVLSFQEIQGQRVPIPKLEITVKPYSNYPNRWEHRLAFLLKMTELKDPMGMPLFPNMVFAIRDHIAIEYPEFGQNGQYGQMSEVITLASQILAQRQQQQQAQQQATEQQSKDISSVRRGFQKKLMREEVETNGAEQ